MSVWLFEKKDLDKWPRYEKELFAEILKRGVSQLTRLRHPRILVIEHPLEESRYMILSVLHGKSEFLSIDAANSPEYLRIGGFGLITVKNTKF